MNYYNMNTKMKCMHKNSCFVIVSHCVYVSQWFITYAKVHEIFRTYKNYASEIYTFYASETYPQISLVI